MLFGLLKRILMVMFILFIEINVGFCIIYYGVNVGNSKISYLINIWMSENFEKKVLLIIKIKYLFLFLVEKLRIDIFYL